MAAAQHKGSIAAALGAGGGDEGQLFGRLGASGEAVSRRALLGAAAALPVIASFETGLRQAQPLLTMNGDEAAEARAPSNILRMVPLPVPGRKGGGARSPGSRRRRLGLGRWRGGPLLRGRSSLRLRMPMVSGSTPCMPRCGGC